MSDLFTEMEEDLKEERLLFLWKKYGNILIGAALLIVLSTAGYTLWSYFQSQKQMERATSFAAAVSLLKNGDEKAARESFQELGKGRGAYGKLALFYEASLLKDSSKIYDVLMGKNKKDAPFENVTKVLIVMRDPSQSKIIEPLINPESLWGALSLELFALSNLSQGKNEEALKSFVKILEDPNATPFEKIRARMMSIGLNSKLPSAQK